MRCPKCGGKILDGQLYCPYCGKEISFVPEFDPEVENRIDESLLGVADNLKDDIFNTKNLFDDSDDHVRYGFSHYLPTILTAVGIVVIAVGLSIFLIKGVHSSRNYEEQAQDSYVNGDLDGALDMIDKAIDNLGAEDTDKLSDLLFKKYGYQVEAGYKDEAIQTLYELSDKEKFTEETTGIAIDKIIEAYQEDDDYAAIKELIQNSDQATKDKYADYIPVKPNIYPEDGEYDKIVEVVIKAADDSDIYYTINGDDPDTLSIKYDDTIVFEEDGDYLVKAVSVNKYGLKSDVTSAFYTLLHRGPAAPEVMEESGDYSQSTMIVAVCDPGCTIYYTTDGSDPNTTSKQYFAPISMPVGTTHFKFVTVDAEGNLSDIVEREYHLTYSKLVSVEQARASIIQILIKMDILLDEYGKMRSQEGYYDYVYDRDIEIEGSGEYYVFVEKHVLNDGSAVDTGLLYAVNTHDGIVNRLGYDSSGKYTLIKLPDR